MPGNPRDRRRWGWIAAGLAAVLILGTGGLMATRSALTAVSETPSAVPTTRVEEGVIEILIHMQGDVRAGRQQAITAPPTGASLRILEMVESGQVVEEGDLLVAFDPADQIYDREQAASQLREAEQEIIKRQAEIDAQNATDQVSLLTARFDVRRAELDARVDQDLIPANDYLIRQVSLEEARRALAQTEQDVEARAKVNSAGLSVLEESRAKAQMAADRARQNLEMLEVRAPIAGVVLVRENLDSTSFFYTGMTLPPYRVGDLVRAGRPLLDLFDMSGLEIRAAVNELDRVNVAEGQPVTVTTSGVPGVEFPATVRSVSNMSQPAQRNAGPLRQFDVTIGLDEPDARLLPGSAVTLVVAGPRLESVLVLPRQAIFEEDGQTISYVRTGESFEAREVTVTHRGGVDVAIEGIDAGTEVALVRPSNVSSGRASSEGSAAPGGLGSPSPRGSPGSSDPGSTPSAPAPRTVVAP